MRPAMDKKENPDSPVSPVEQTRNNAFDSASLQAARAGDKSAFASLVDSYRQTLLLHCYHMLGSLQDAEDLVQETLLRAWKRLDTFEGRSSFHTWLYKIATNACLDALDKQRRRTLPVITYPESSSVNPVEPPLAEPVWLEPYPDELLPEAADSPEEHYIGQESISLAFQVALQLLSPRQRAVLILRDVLGWHTAEVAALFEISAAAVNSALHRARLALARQYHPEPSDSPPGDTASTQGLLARYLRAWETANIPELLELLKEEAAFSMPPSPSWYRGREAIGTIFSNIVFKDGSRLRLIPTRASGQPAFGFYQMNASNDRYQAAGIQVLTVSGGQIAAITTFMTPSLVARFGLPADLPS